MRRAHALSSPPSTSPSSCTRSSKLGARGGVSKGHGAHNSSRQQQRKGYNLMEQGWRAQKKTSRSLNSEFEQQKLSSPFFFKSNRSRAVRPVNAFSHTDSHDPCSSTPLGKLTGFQKGLIAASLDMHVELDCPRQPTPIPHNGGGASSLQGQGCDSPTAMGGCYTAPMTRSAAKRRELDYLACNMSMLHMSSGMCEGVQ